MSNIIAADFYRMRKGAALRNTFIGIVAVVVVVMVVMLFAQSGLATQITAPNGMTSAEITELEHDMAEAAAETAHINSGASFGMELLGESFIFLFFLPIAIAVFCADFSAGTYRNTLSFESDRGKVYFGKVLLSTGLCLAMVLGMLAVSWLLGSIAFGFTGFTAAYFTKLFTVLLLQLPTFLSTIAVCHCLIAFTKKSSMAITFFLVGYFVLVLAIQFATGFFSGVEWMGLMEPQGAGRMLAVYDAIPSGYVLFALVYHLGVAAVATLLGVLHFRKADMP